MEDGDGEDRPPFWLQNATHLRRSDRLRRGVSAVLFSSGLVVLLLLVTAVVFLVFVVPSTLSFSVHIFRPNSVKKSWDSLNVVLVIVAVVFGFLSRNKNEERDSYFDGFQSSPIKENGSSQKSFNSVGQKYESEQKNLILKRNSSSYPDLREFSSVNWSYGDYQARFYDDIHVDSGRVSDPGLLYHHRRYRSLEQVDYLRERPESRNVVVVDTLVRESKEASNPPSSPPPPAEDEEFPKNAAARKERSGRKMNKDLESFNSVAASKPPLPPVGEYPAPEFQENQKRGNERVARRKERLNRKQNKDVEAMNTVTVPPPPQAPPPPPPPPPPPKEKISKSDRKRGGATGTSTKDFLNSLYHKKKKKQRQKSVDNMDSLLHEAEAPLSVQIPPPPPPPPPPSVFQNLFSSKKQKRKRTITVTLEPHPPPRAQAREPEPSSRVPAVTAGKPPQPIKMSSFDKLEEASNSGGESPLNRIPPPPPPPPPAFFRSPAWKFVVQGDYVRINSNNSSRSGSPDPDETESDVTPSAAYGGDAVAFHPSPLFCPSPDVNTKAESFITNFRAKLKLEKIHSMKKREPGLSSLGPGPSQI